MRATTFFAPFLAAVSLASVACTADSSPSPSSSAGEGDTPVAVSALTRNESPVVPAADMSALVDGDNAFAADLYKTLREDGKNLFFSPESVSTALAMTYAGARGATAGEMASTLHFTLSQDKLHNAKNGLDLALNSRGKNAKGSDGQPFRLRVANSLWGQPGVPFQTPFLDTIAENYGAGVRLTDFLHDAEGSRATINQWVERQTEERIKDLLPEGSVLPDTRLVLVNAVYFNGAWATPFETTATTQGTFHGASGDRPADLMHQTAMLSYAKGDGYQAVAIPYDGNELDLFAVVPDEGSFDAVESRLDGGMLTSIAGSLAPTQVALGLPKFKLEGSSTSLKPALQTLGMKAAFEVGAADFTGIDGATGERLYIGDVIHQAFVSVDEKGTEAAASTAVVMEGGAAPSPDVVELSIDRPFVFVVRDRATGAFVFMGRVLSL